MKLIRTTLIVAFALSITALTGCGGGGGASVSNIQSGGATNKSSDSNAQSNPVEMPPAPPVNPFG